MSWVRAPDLPRVRGGRYRARIVHWVSVAIVATVLPLTLLTPVLLEDWGLRVAVLSVPVVASLLALGFVRRGWLATASSLSLGSLWFTVTALVIAQPALDSSAWPAYVLPVCLAGLLFKRRFAVMMTLAAVLLGGLCVFLFEYGLAVARVGPTTPLSRWVVGSLVIGAVAALVLFGMGQLRDALAIATENRNRLGSIFDAYADGVFIHKIHGDILEVNPAACQIFGYTRAEIMTVEVAQLADREFRSDWVAQARELKPGQRCRLQGTGYRKTGAPFPLEVDAKPILYNGVPCFLTTVRDVTERKAEERARRALEDQLRLAQRMEALGRLVGGIAHDFNNQLTVIGGYARLLESEIEANSPWLKKLKPIHQAAQHSATLIRQLLAFSRQQVLKPRVIDLTDIMERLEEILGRVLGEDIALDMTQDEDLGPVCADPVQLEQVLLNLAINARDAMPNGGTLSIDTTNVVLDRMACEFQPELRPGPHVRIRVTDTGAGMTRETAERIFEPFFTTKEERGTGLGLSTALGIVKQSGGSISVSTEPARGTTFRIFLPQVVGDVEREVPPVHPPDEEFVGAKTVLLVEDQDTVRSLLYRVLADNGYTVIEAADGRQGLKKSQAYRGSIDLVVTDVIMPEVGGVEMVSQVRAARPDIRVLYVTGYTENLDLRSGEIKPGEALLQKPFTPQEMLRTMRGLLELDDQEVEPASLEGLRP